MSFGVQNITVNQAVNQSIIQVNNELANIPTTQILSGEGIVDTVLPFTYIINNSGSYTITLPNSTQPGKQKTIIVTENSDPYLVVSLVYNDGYSGSSISIQFSVVNTMIVLIANTVGWNIFYSSYNILPTVNTLSFRQHGSNELEMFGIVLSQGSSPISAMGIVYSHTNAVPVIETDTVVNYSPITIGNNYGIIFSVSSYTLYYSRAFATNSSGTSYGDVLTAEIAPCLAYDTMITLHDGTTKPIQDIEYTDTLKVWNFDEGCFDIAKPLWIKQENTVNSYNLVKFSNGSILKTVVDHRILNKELGKFTHTMKKDTPIGTHTLTIDGEEIELIERYVVTEEIKCYNINGRTSSRKA